MKRRGRPRKLKTRRYRNGKPSDMPKAEREEDVRRTATEARTRVYGLQSYQAKDERAGSAVGRLRLGGGISYEQFEAALEFEKIARAYEKAILIRQIPSAGDLDRTHGYDGADGTDKGYVERCNQAIERYAESRRALLEADPLAMMAVQSWVMQDQWIMRLIGELRVGLNALARLYRVEEWQSGKRRATA